MIPLGVLGSAHVPAAADGALFTFTDAKDGGSVAVSPTTTTGLAIGAAGGARTVVVVVSVGSTGTSLTRVPASMTIGGVSATNDVALGTGAGTSSIWRATVPTGTTADVVITWNAANSGVNFTVYTFVSPAAVSVVDTGTGDDTDQDHAVTLTLAAANGGHVIAGSGMYYSTSAGSVTGAEDVSIDIKKMAAHGPTSSPSVTVTFNQNAASSGSRFRVAAATYQAA